jgi:hypothetical protein
VQSACNASSSNIQQPTSGHQGTQPPAAATAQFGTPEEAQAMLQKAVDHYNSVGRTQALSDFNHRVAPFFDRDLYVACIDSNLVISANGGFPNLVGTTTEPLSRAAWDAATTNKIDSVNYSYTDPANGNTLPKTFYYEKVGSDVCGVGAYHP